MSISIEFSPTPLAAMATITEKTPPREWNSQGLGVDTAEIEKAYREALVESGEVTHPEAEADTVETPQICVGPLVPDEFVEEAPPPDGELFEQAVGSHRRLLLMAGMALGGLFLGILSALLV